MCANETTKMYSAYAGVRVASGNCVQATTKVDKEFLEVTAVFSRIPRKRQSEIVAQGRGFTVNALVTADEGLPFGTRVRCARRWGLGCDVVTNGGGG